MGMETILFTDLDQIHINFLSPFAWMLHMKFIIVPVIKGEKLFESVDVRQTIDDEDYQAYHPVSSP